MRCNVILAIAVIVAVAAVACTRELYRWLQNRRYSRAVRVETVRWGKSR
jgi:hypothetical protein